MSEKKSILTIDNLLIQFGGLKAISDVSIHVDEGDFVGIIGPNGAGKTTLYNAITGNVPLTSGSISFMGKNLAKLRPDQINNLGISRTFQNIRLFPKMSALWNVSASLSSVPRYNILEAFLRTPKVKRIDREVEEKAYYYLELMGLKGYENQQAGNMPYGLQRRLEIARALACEPKLLLLDEPAAGMNNDECNELADVLRKIKKELNITIVLIEHHMDFVMQLCERLYVLNLGEILAEGTPEEVQNDPKVIKAYLGERREIDG